MTVSTSCVRLVTRQSRRQSPLLVNIHVIGDVENDLRSLFRRLL